MDKIWLIICWVWIGIGVLSGQKPPETEEEFEKAYERRIRQDYLSGVYIPKDLTEAFIELNKLIDKDSKMKFKKVEEEVAVRKLHFSLGRWLSYNWGFYGGSRLSIFLNKIGLFHPDEMARFIIITYHRNLNKKSLGVKELIAAFEEERKQKEAERLKKGTVIFEETRKRTKQ